MRHYETNRAPLGIYMHAAWLIGHPEMFEALLYWLDQVSKVIKLFPLLNDTQDKPFTGYTFASRSSWCTFQRLQVRLLAFYTNIRLDKMLASDQS